MSKNSPATELRSFSADDLRKEIAAKRTVVSKLRLGIQMRTEKDSAKYRREKLQLARMLTVLTEKERALPASKAPATLPASVAKKRPVRKAA